MKIVQEGSYEVIFRTSETGPALLVMKVDHSTATFEITTLEIIELATALGIGPAIAGLIGKKFLK